MIRWTFATAADLERFYGGQSPPRPTLRAVVVKLEDEPQVIIGLYRRGYVEMLFSDYKPDFCEHLHRITVMRALKAVMRWVQWSRKPVYSLREEGSDMLQRLGFEHVDGELYRWPS